MAENRRQNYEIKYIRRLLSGVDARIVVPESVRGPALRRSIEEITPAPPPLTARELFFPNKKKWLSWQSGLSYAAAFALIVGLFYGLGLHRRDNLVDGQLAVDSSGTEFAVAEDALIDSADADAIAEDAEPFTQAQDTPEIAALDGGEAGDAGPGAQPAPAEQPAVGGSGPSVGLGVMDGYVISYRANDANDPDKAETPITLEVIDVADDALVAQVDLPLDTLEQSYIQEDSRTVLLVGTAQTGVAAYAVDLAETAPSEQPLLQQPGRLIASRIHDGFLHIVSYAEGPEEVDGAIERLPDSTQDGVCVITALDLSDHSVSRKAYVGASEEIKLYNINVYISYEGVAGDEDAGMRLVQVRLDGGEMELGSVS